MAWTTNKSAGTSKAGGIEFCYSTDLQGAEDIIATPGAGKHLLISRLNLACVDALDVTIREAAVAQFTVEFVATSGSPVDLVFNPAWRLPDNKALTAIASAAGKVTIICQWKIE